MGDASANGILLSSPLLPARLPRAVVKYDLRHFQFRPRLETDWSPFWEAPGPYFKSTPAKPFLPPFERRDSSPKKSTFPWESFWKSNRPWFFNPATKPLNDRFRWPAGWGQIAATCPPRRPLSQKPRIAGFFNVQTPAMGRFAEIFFRPLQAWTYPFFGRPERSKGPFRGPSEGRKSSLFELKSEFFWIPKDQTLFPQFWRKKCLQVLKRPPFQKPEPLRSIKCSKMAKFNAWRVKTPKIFRIGQTFNLAPSKMSFLSHFWGKNASKMTPFFWRSQSKKWQFCLFRGKNFLRKPFRASLRVLSFFKGAKGFP